MRMWKKIMHIIHIFSSSITNNKKRWLAAAIVHSKNRQIDNVKREKHESYKNNK